MQLMSVLSPWRAGCGAVGAGARRASTRRRLRFVSLVAAPTLLGAGALACDDESEDPPSAMLEGVGVTGRKPFMKAPRADLHGVRSTVKGTSEVAGGAPGAFGGTHRTAHCDKRMLVQQLTRDRVRAEAWSGVRGIDHRRIGPYIDGLTSAILLNDTLVVNHNYQGGGRTYAYRAVLQAGVAVLIDEYGSPVVKCNCGNPLLRPPVALDTAAFVYQGESWAEFRSGRIVYVRPRTAEEGPMERVVLVDPFKRDLAFSREVGTDGAADGPMEPFEPTQSPGPTTDEPTQPTGEPTAPTDGPTIPTGEPTAPTEAPTGPTVEPTEAPGGGATDPTVPTEPGPGDQPPEPAPPLGNTAGQVPSAPPAAPPPDSR